MKIATVALSILAITQLAGAQTKSFKVVGDKLSYRNVATVESASDFETFTGKTNLVSGKISLNLAKKTGTGTIEVDAASIDTGIPLRNDHMKSAGWLDTAKYPTIKFQTVSVKSLGGDNYKIVGKYTMHGITKTVTTTATVKVKAEGDATKKAGFSGDVLQIKTKFNIKLSDYGIKIPDMAKGKVANEVTISLNAYATTK